MEAVLLRFPGFSNFWCSAFKSAGLIICHAHHLYSSSFWNVLCILFSLISVASYWTDTSHSGGALLPYLHMRMKWLIYQDEIGMWTTEYPDHEYAQADRHVK